MTSAFIVEVNSELQPDPNEETAALLRVLIHKVDNTTFGNDVPSIPQWAGPPQTIVQVQAILFASLATSLFSAFLAMLGKQWLNRYTSVGMRGSAVERSQNRQRKLDGIIDWYFNHVMESLPMMLQVALLLLGFALSHYLRAINKTVALVVIGITWSGVLFFLFIVIAGATSISCPYQTPGAQILRRVPGAICRTADALRFISDILDKIPSTIPHALRDIPYFIRRIPDILRRVPGILHRIPDILHRIAATIRRISHSLLSPLFSASVKGSICCNTLSRAWDYLAEGAPYTLTDAATALLFVFLLPVWLVADAWKVIVWHLVFFSRFQKPGPAQKTALLDLHCISWALQTSLDGSVRLSALNHLAATKLTDFDPTLVVDCFNILFGCVKAINDKAVAAQGMEPLAAASSICCLRMLSHLMAVDPTSTIIEDTHGRYVKAFPPQTYLNSLPCSDTLHVIHWAFHLGNLPLQNQWKRNLWKGDRPFSDEHVMVAQALTKVAQFKYRGRRARVPCWILRFVLHSLSQSPPPPASVVIDSLSIVAISLGYNPLNIGASNERCVRIRGGCLLL